VSREFNLSTESISIRETVFLLDISLITTVLFRNN